MTPPGRVYEDGVPVAATEYADCFLKGLVPVDVPFASLCAGVQIFLEAYSSFKRATPASAFFNAL